MGAAKPAALALLALLASSALHAEAAGAPGTVDLLAEEMLLKGVGALGGPLLALRVHHAGAAPPSEAMPFLLEAESVRIETDYETHPFEAVPAAAAPGGPGSVGTTSRSYGGARVRAAPHGEDHDLWLLASGPGAQAEVGWATDRGALGPSPVDRVEVGSRVNAPERSPEGVPTQDALLLSGATGLRGAKVSGSFVLSVYGWNLTVEEPATGKREEHFSGRRAEPVQGAPVSPLRAERDVEYRQLHLYVTNGTLELRSPPLQGTELYLAQGRLAVPSEVAFYAPRSLSVDGAARTDLEAERVLLLRGDLQVDVERAGSQVHARVSGAILQASLDGRALGLEAAAPAAGAARSFGLWLAGAALVVAAPACAYGWARLRRRRERRLLERLEHAMASGRHEEVARRADALLRSRGFRQDAAALKADALVRLGRAREARAFLAALEGWPAPEAATLDYFRAYAAAHEGDLDEAAARLVRCLRAASEFRRDALREPAFRPLGERPEVAALLRGPDMNPNDAVAYQ